MNSANESAVPDGCLDADAIAALIDGGAAGYAEKLAHVASCVVCRERVASAAEAIEDPAIKAEMNAVDHSRHVTRASRRWIGVSLATMAAAAVLVVIGPLKSFRNSTVPGEFDAIHRDASITSTIAPRIVSPGPGATFADSLRWTSIANADLYRIRVWNPSGDVIWSAESRDTILAMPRELTANTRYLWEVDARTGWDRWVSSNFVEFTLHDLAH
ncbi:MAG: hypothetical protein ABJC63_08795 [Gemmatimonadales bacterium]